MLKEVESILPRDVESEPVTVTIGGYDEPGEPVAPPSTEGDHLLSVDEVAQWYAEEEELSIDIPKKFIHLPTDDFGRTIDPSEKVKKTKKKEKKQKISKKELIQSLLCNCEEGDDEEKSMVAYPAFPPAIQEHQGPLKEHELYRILTKKYLFGWYGSDLYVRGTDYVYSPVNERTVERLLMSTLTEDQKENFRISASKGVLKRLLASDEISKNQLTFPKEKILVANGCFDLRTKKLTKIEDSDFFVCRINARYLPGEKLSCPHFDRYLETSSGGDKSIQERICAMLGYLMTCGYPGKKIIVLGMAKNSGKSMISRFYQRLVGPALVCGQTPFDMSENHALSEFSGKIANMALDIPATIIKPEAIGVMKALSGGDRISVNPKNRDRSSANCYTKQILGTNAPLRLQQYDEAFWERVEIIPYIYSVAPDERDEDLENRLMEERDAIVTKCLKFTRRLIKNGYQFPPCAVADAMKDSWIGWQANARAFLNAHCVAEKGSFTPSTLLYSAYQRYCNEQLVVCGTPTGFIRFAKNMFGIPLNETARSTIDGEQLRGLPDIRFLGEY